jgi:WD40 repeat protein
VLIYRSKKVRFLFIACWLLFLFSACGAAPSSQAGSSVQASSIPTPVSTQALTATPATPTMPASTPTATSMPAAGSSLTSSCPVHPAVMPSLPAGSQPGVVYLSERGGFQASMTDAQLIRYDSSTKSKSVLVSFAQSDVAITEAQVSADGQWVLFLTASLSQNQTKLQLIRADGQNLQTLYCVPPYTISNIRWSPDKQHVAFAVPGSDGRISTIVVLNLSNGQQEAFQVHNYSPYAWLNTTQLYVVQPQGDQSTSALNLSLLDISKGSAQQAGNLLTIASANGLCGAFEQSSDGKQLFTSSCTPVNANGCQGPATQGPSALNVLPATGGSAKTIYSSQSQAIMTLYAASSQTLLMYVENTYGNLSQNGLWKINADGSGLTRLTNVAGQQCDDLSYPAFLPQIASAGQQYALRIADARARNEVLLVGSLNGGVPTAVETKSIDDGVLILVGVVEL